MRNRRNNGSTVAAAARTTDGWAQRAAAAIANSRAASHDFNNLLQVISSSLQLLDRHVSPVERAQRRPYQGYSELGPGTTISIYPPRSCEKEDEPVDVALDSVLG